MQVLENKAKKTLIALNNDYHFITHWRVKGTVKEVTDILGDAAALSNWWPSVYLDVDVLEQGDERGLGKVVDLYTKGWLPYTLRWQFRVTEVRDDGFTLVARGDFVGRGIWTFQQDGDWVNIIYDWKLSAKKPLLRYGSLLMKPIFAANHRWAMARGEESLRLELARCRAKNAQERAQIPAPPPPTTISVPLLLTVGVGCVVLIVSGYLTRKSSVSKT
jgi:hypothetical protein